MKINLKHVMAFVTLAETKTFADAAERLFISQPALSTTIKNMESALGGKLFSRSTRRVLLTPEGKAFLPVAKRLMVDWDTALFDVRSHFEMQLGVLNISAMPSFADGLLANYLAEFNLTFSNIKLRLMDEVMERVIENVRDERTELGFIFEPYDLSGLEFTSLFTDDFMLVTPTSHKYLKTGMASVIDLDAQPMIVMNIESDIRQWIDNNIKALGILPKIVAETSQFSTLGQLVSQGLGVSIAPKICKQLMVSKGCRCIDLNTDRFARKIGIIEKKKSELSTVASAFKKFMLEQYTPLTTFS